jgi:hypothetical protein
MSELRLYLYRKAGREVWDAEMWLPDGRRRVWRTGIADRDEAQEAARARLESLVASTAAAPPVAGASATAADDDVGGTAQIGNVVEAPVDAEAEPMTGTGTPASVAEQTEQTAPVVEAQARGATWSERFDRWLFAELASLWRARA